MRWRSGLCMAAIGAAMLSACEWDFSSGGGGPTPSPTATPTPSPAPFVVIVDFATDATWTPGFADFSPGMEPLVDFASGLKPVPPALAGTNGYLLGGNNPADDVALFVWRKVENLEPGAAYRIETEVELATNAPAGCAGIGGAPGESVTFKAGGGSREPALVLNGEGLLTLNLDKGNQTEGGADAAVIGDLASPDAGTCDVPVYARKTLSSDGHGPTVRSDASGALWLLLTTDSGYEGRTEIYLLSARLELVRA